MLGDFKGGEGEAMDHLPEKNAQVHRNMHTTSGVNWVRVPPNPHPGAYRWAHEFQVKKNHKN